jgi:hypothetical protein
MSGSIKAEKAKATHDAAMSIIAGEARARALKTERLRQLRLAQEAQAMVCDHGASSVSKSRNRSAANRPAAR